METSEKTKRLNDFKYLLEVYEKFVREYRCPEPEMLHNLIVERAEILNNTYFELVPEIKLHLIKGEKARINKYKIIAGIQATIMLVLPFKLPSCEIEPNLSVMREWNADFAIFSAIQIIKSWEHEGWNEIETKNFQTKFDEALKKIENKLIQKDHFIWLSSYEFNKNKEGKVVFPVFLCSQFWQMVSLYIEQYAGIQHKF